MQITVDFIDVPCDHSWSVELTDRDEIFINDVWYKEDSLLVELKDQEPFSGRTAWCDLDMIHYQLLLFKCFDLLGENHPMDDLTVKYKEPFATFKFLASAIVKMSKLNGVMGFDTVTIMRPRENRIVVDFRRTYRFDWESYVPPKPEHTAEIIPIKKNPFQLVVDNTK